MLTVVLPKGSLEKQVLDRLAAPDQSRLPVRDEDDRRPRQRSAPGLGWSGLGGVLLLLLAGSTARPPRATGVRHLRPSLQLPDGRRNPTLHGKSPAL